MKDDPINKSKESKAMTAWNVYHKGKLFDIVFYNAGIDADYVKRSLINHDGYPSSIVVKKKK